MMGISRGRGTSTLVTVQYLRAFAAIIVVYYHVFSNQVAAHWSAGRNFGILGVDVFFIISGFIMWISTNPQSGVLQFFKRRVCRIYPMWWIALTVWIVSRLIIPDRLHNMDVTLTSVIDSYLLIPHYHNVFTGRIWPILVPGWTLQLEIFFYILFGFSLFISRNSIRFSFVLSTLCLFAAFGSVVAPTNAIINTYTNPLLLEFSMGIVFAALLPYLQKAPFILGVVAIALGIVCLWLGYNHIVDNGLARVIILGVPAAFIVSGLLMLEKVLAKRPSNLFLLLGDASYSLYLVHPIAISAAAVIWEKLRLPSGDHYAAICFIPVAISFSLLLAVGTYKWVEAPLLNRLIYSRIRTPYRPSLPKKLLKTEEVDPATPEIALPVPQFSNPE